MNNRSAPEDFAATFPTKPLSACLESLKVPAKIPRSLFLTDGKLPIISQESGFINGYWDNEADAIRIDSPVVVFGDHTQVLKLVDFDFVVGADGVKILKPKDFLDAAFLRYFLEANPIPSLGYARHYRHISGMEIPLPPLEDQEQIVAVLDQAFAALDRARAHAEANLADCRKLFAAAVSSVVKRKSNKQQKTLRLGSIVTRLTNGYVGPISDVYVESGIPYLLARQVRENTLAFDRRTYVTQEFNDKHKKSKLKAGDVLLVQSGHIGHSAVVPDEHEGHNCHAMIVITPVEEIVSGTYLSALFNTPEMQDAFQNIRTGSTVPHLTCKMVKELMIEVPPRLVQDEIIQEIENLKARIEIAKQRCKADVADLANLRQSLLQKAFSGELT